jgi:hypothetical protein
VDDARAVPYHRENPDFAGDLRIARERGERVGKKQGLLLMQTPRPGEWVFNSTRVLGKDGTKLQDITDAMIEGRQQVMEVAAFMRKYIPGFENARVTETADHIGVRETRRILCDYTITTRDVLEVPAFEDAIARGNWYVDIHSPTDGTTQHIHPPQGKFYEIPYRSIRARGLRNLLIASRCIDCSHEAHAAIRITPQVVAIGEGAGTAAALCLRQGLHSTRDLDAGTLRQTLRANGAFV